MIPYLVTFFFSTCAIYASEKINNRNIERLLIVIGILIPSVLAGCRADTIGTDVLSYGKSYYNKAVSYEDLTGYVKLILSYDVKDIGYMVLTFLCSRLSDNYHLGLFAYSLLTSSFLYAAYARLKKQYNTPVWLGMLLYYLVLYNISLNAIRQCLAVACVFLAFTYLIDNRIRRYILYCAIAVTLHTSGVIGFVLGCMYIILKEGKKATPKKQIFQGMIFIGPIIIAVVIAPFFIKWLVSLGFFRANYLNYLPGGKYAQDAGVSFTVLVPQMAYFAISCVCFLMSNGKIRENLYLFVCSASCFALAFGTAVSAYFIRCSYFFLPVEMLYMMLSAGCFNRKSRRLWLAGVVSFAFALWVRDYVIFNFNETMPYVFSLQ